MKNYYKPKTYQYKTKKQRRQWWNSLSFYQQQIYIEKRQAIKAKRHKNQSKRVLRYNPEYPWMTEGVNETNRAQWWAMIKKKNPWLKVA